MKDYLAGNKTLCDFLHELLQKPEKSGTPRTFKGEKMELKKLYSQALNYAKHALEDAERVQENQLKLSPDDYNCPDDFEQEKQENSQKVYELSVYIMKLENLEKEMKIQGISIV